MTAITRRTLAKGSAALAATALMAPSLARSQDAPNELDIAVVGGGVSGLYAAMRLSKSVNGSVAVFEATDRLGGRIMSVQMPGVQSETAELGAMRLRESDAIPLKIMRDHVGSSVLQDFDYPVGTWYLRDTRLETLDDPSTLPYALNDDEKALLSGGTNLLTDALDRMKDADIDGKGLWQELLKLRSREGFSFINDSFGYQSLFSNWDAQAALPWLKDEVSPDQKYVRVRGGLEQLPLALASAFKSDGNDIHLNHQLVTINKFGDGPYELIFQNNSGERRVTATRIILAVPPNAFEHMDPDTFLLQDKRFKKALGSVNKASFGTVCLTFETAWWDGAGFSEGRLISDLPMDQAYRWGADPDSGHALMIGSYHDGRNVGFWDALRDGDAYGDGDWIAGATGADGKALPQSLQRSLPASKRLVEELWSQIKLVHGIGDDVAAPLTAIYQNWDDQPWGAALHLWAIGADPDAEIAYLQEPFADIHVCGEAWSHQQGWVAGALETAETMLQDKFGLDPFVRL